MSKTAMQEYIQWLKEVVEISKAQDFSTEIINTLEYCIEGAKTKLEMEKEQIEKAFNEGTFALDEKTNAEEYYNETYGGQDNE